MRLKTRNHLARAAWERGGAGLHKDKRKEAARKACRGPVRE